MSNHTSPRDRVNSKLFPSLFDTEEVTCSIHVPPTIFSLNFTLLLPPYKVVFVFGWPNGWPRVPGGGENLP